ncbi:MAG: hypothetical protein DWQ09_11575 [Proteobacteria bacterium]|nr:MAG: hypothetical protein DWQ09_11575 [Pseudomonadota bacterium]
MGVAFPEKREAIRMSADTNLQLHLPDLQAAGDTAMPYQAKAVRAWLSELPMADHERAAGALIQGIASVNRQRLTLTDRLSYLGYVDETAGTLLASLRQRIRHHLLPLSPHGDQIARLIRGLHRELALGYKRVLMDNAEAGLFGHLSKRASALALHGAMAYLGELVLDYFQTYQPPQTGIWRDLHQLYRYAEQHGLLGSRLTELHTPYGKESNLQRLYLRLLLLTLASPYRLRPGELDWVNEALARWVGLCEVRPPPSHETGIGTLVIDLESDEPTDQSLENSEITPARHRIVTTIDLLPVLRQELTTFHELGTLPKTSDGGTLSADIYRRLTQAWGTSPQRSFSRSERAHSLDITIGFTSLCRLIAAGRGVETSAQPLDVVPDDRPRATGEYVIEPKSQDVWSLVYTSSGTSPDQDELPLETHRCGTINESAGGFCLVTHKESQLRARVGELVGIRDESARGEWEIGVIRWMRDSESEHMEFGVQMIAPCARVIRIGSGESDTGRIAGESALILPAVRAVMQPISLITALSGYPVGTSLSVESPAGDVTLHLSRMLESTGSFSHYQCSPDEGLVALLGECG